MNNVYRSVTSMNGVDGLLSVGLFRSMLSLLSMSAAFADLNKGGGRSTSSSCKVAGLGQVAGGISWMDALSRRTLACRGV